MLTLRAPRPDEAETLGRICYEAFSSIAGAHNFPMDFPSAGHATGLITSLIANPGIHGVVAEEDGKLLGSNFLDERCAVFSIGPITVDPRIQNKGVGRRLMQAVLDRTAERGAPGVRLLQAGYHTRSLSLYASLGFEIREPIACMSGPAIEAGPPGIEVRKAAPADLAACNQLCRRVHGHERGGELGPAIDQGSAVVAMRAGRITGYASQLAFFGHTVGETSDDIKAIVAASGAVGPPGILIPTRNGELFRWCLENGLRVTQTLTLMTQGLYNEPAGAWLPSVMC